MVPIPYRPSSGALQLLIDSTAVKAEGEGEWLSRKHEPSKPWDWRQVQLGIDAEPLEIRAIEIAGGRGCDAPMLPDLQDQMPGEESIGIVTSDCAYDTHACHAAIAERGASTVIPPRKNGQPRKEHRAEEISRNEALRSCRRLDRAIWTRWTGDLRRSLVESKMRRLMLLGERVMSRDFGRQVAELRIRAAILNRLPSELRPSSAKDGSVQEKEGAADTRYVKNV